MLKAVKYRKYGDETSIRQTISGAFRVTCQWGYVCQMLSGELSIKQI
jgi:hypothetical protein